MTPIRHRLLGCVVALIVVAGAAAADVGEARRLAAEGRADEALAVLDRIAAADPDDASAELLRGVLLVETGRHAEAERVFRDMTRRWPALPEAYNNLAVIQASSGRYPEAIETLLASLATHASYDTAYDNLTRIYSRLAGEAYREALSDVAEGEVPDVDLVLLSDLAGSATAAGSVVAAAPEEAPGDAPPTPTEEPHGEVEPELLETVKAWAAAWSAQRTDAYLAFYARDFRPPGGVSRAFWERQRRARLTRPRYIRVSLSFRGSRRLAADRAEVELVQTYESDRYADRVTKVLELVREGGGWKILAERVRP